MKNKEDITIAIEILRKIELKNAKECSIMAAGNHEEAVVIGTKDALVFLALKLLEIVNVSNGKQIMNMEMDKEIIKDELFEYTNEIKYSFDEFGDVWPVCVYLAKNNEGLKKLKKYFSDD